MAGNEGPKRGGGKKFDEGKADHSLIPKIALDRTAEAFMVGERKYGRYNYCEGMEASRLVGAAMRHLTSWFDGTEFDPTDGQHHLGSVIACASMILRQQELGTLVDNRYVVATPSTSLVDDDLVELQFADEPTTTNYNQPIEADGKITVYPKLK